MAARRHYGPVPPRGGRRFGVRWLVAVDGLRSAWYERNQRTVQPSKAYVWYRTDFTDRLSWAKKNHACLGCGGEIGPNVQVFALKRDADGYPGMVHVACMDDLMARSTRTAR